VKQERGRIRGDVRTETEEFDVSIRRAWRLRCVFRTSSPPSGSKEIREQEFEDLGQ